MRTITKIACRTIGALGAGLVAYDATKSAKYYSRTGGYNETSKYLDHAYFNGRTTDTDSYISEGIRKKTMDLRMRDPLPTVWGKIKGTFKGIFNALSNNFVLIGCSAMALLSKKLPAKIGAIGVPLVLAYDVIHNGFGVGKPNPKN